MFITTAYQQPINKIISLVPSLTELLYTLGLDVETVGITKFCTHPPIWFSQKDKIGGTKNINIKKIMALQPNLIICNKEENIKNQIEQLAEILPVYVTDVTDVESALQTIKDIGLLTAKREIATALAAKIKQSFTYKTPKLYKAIYLIWNNPYMTVGGDTFINSMMQKAGFINIFENEQRYPTIDIEKMVELQPQVILLSSEPYPFKNKHIIELQAHLPNTKILLADGEMFSWYGSRMVLAAAYFKKLYAQVESL